MVFLFRIDNDVFRLYIGNLSANQALSVFPSDTVVSIEKYGDIGQKGGDWITESDLPPIANVRELRKFLASEKCNYINLEVIVGEKTIFSAHEDAECDFAFQSKADVSWVIESLVSPSVSESLITSLSENQNIYFECASKDQLQRHDSFDDYIANRT